MDIITWNCRGTLNNNFRMEFSNLMWIHSPDVIALMETKVPFTAMGNFFNRFNLSESVIVDPEGRSGGIWLLWNPASVNIQPVYISPQAIHVSVKKVNL